MAAAAGVETLMKCQRASNHSQTIDPMAIQSIRVVETIQKGMSICRRAE